MAKTGSYSGELPKAIAQSFRSTLSLPEGKLKAINTWVRQNLPSFLEGPDDSNDVHTIADQLGVSHSDFVQAMSFVGATLMDEEMPGTVDIDAYIEWLKTTGVGDVAEKARILLQGISIPQHDAVYIPQKTLAVRSIVPTLEDADAVCDLRAVFRRLPSPSRSALHEENVKAVLGFEPVVLVGLHLNDATGNDSACTFQLTEKGLRSLLKTLNEALVQLEIVSEKKKFIPEES